MSQKIFINLPVADLEASRTFFAKVGYSFDLRFTDETAACMKVSDTIYVMLLTHAKFKEFTTLEIVDAKKATQVLMALTYDSREEVDAVMEKALAAGGTEFRPATDMGFMYQRAYADLDGHVWEMMWMDPAAIPQG